MRIHSCIATSIPDTRGRPTVETALTSGDHQAVASVPSGKSTGKHEACEIDAVRAIEHVNGEIARALAGQDFASPEEIDELLIALDGTPDKSRLGANAILSVSIAAMRLFAQTEGMPLWKAIAERAGTTPSAPHLFINMMEGGVHADFKLPFQEYLLVVGGKTSEALPLAQEAFAKLGERLCKSDLHSSCESQTYTNDVSMGDEGGYAPTFDTLERPFELLSELVKEFPNTAIGIDAAASELFKNGSYQLLGKSYSADELASVYQGLASLYPVHSIEDPFTENAPADFAKLTALLGDHVHIVGDDLTVTNPARIKDAAENKEINAVIIKPNQIGTVKEALEAVKETSAVGFKAIASHRSGETADTFIADFAYGTGCHGLKAGGLGQPERLAKYERLLAIERKAETV